jgi:hypothetical protein
MYVFSKDGASTHVDKFRGLLRYSPFQPAKNADPSYLFIFNQNDRAFANQLFFALSNGIASFPGSRQFVGVSIAKDRLEPLRLAPNLYRAQRERELYEAVCSHLDKSTSKPGFAYIIGDQNWRFHRPTPYGAIKAALLRSGVPSQMVTKQLLQAESQFRYAIPNIALSVLAKLGGVPWLVRRTGEPPALVIGVGTTLVTAPEGKARNRVLGYAICMLSTGLFLDLDFYGVASSHEEFLPTLTEGLSSTLDRLQKANTQISKVSLHVSHFERYETIAALTALLDKRKTAQPTPFEVLRLSHDSSFMVMDTDDVGYVAEEGTVVLLAQRHSLIVMEGRHEKAPWRGRKPVTLEVHREYASNPSLALGDSLQDVFHLGFVNWRGFGTKTKPATLAYAKLLSDRVADITAVAPEVAEALRCDESLGKSLWFL